MTVYLGSRKSLDRFWQALNPHEPALTKYDGSREIWLSESLKPEDFGQFDEKLDGVLVRWIEVWRRAGGLRRLWARTADAEE